MFNTILYTPAPSMTVPSTEHVRYGYGRVPVLSEENIAEIRSWGFPQEILNHIASYLPSVVRFYFDHVGLISMNNNEITRARQDFIDSLFFHLGHLSWTYVVENSWGIVTQSYPSSEILNVICMAREKVFVQETISFTELTIHEFCHNSQVFVEIPYIVEPGRYYISEGRMKHIQNEILYLDSDIGFHMSDLSYHEYVHYEFLEKYDIVIFGCGCSSHEMTDEFVERMLSS